MSFGSLPDDFRIFYPSRTSEEKQHDWNTLFATKNLYNTSVWPIVLEDFQDMIRDIEPDFIQYIPGIIAQYSPFVDILTNLNEIFYIPEDSQKEIFSLLRTYAQKNELTKEIDTFINHTLTDNERFHRPLTA